MNILVSTCSVKAGSNNIRYFEYQCMRYVYNTNKSRFEPYEYDLGSTHKKLQAWSGGVTNEEAENRVAMLGPNIIKVYVPSIPVAVVQE